MRAEGALLVKLAHLIRVNQLRQRLKQALFLRLQLAWLRGDRSKVLRDRRVIFARLAASKHADIAVFVAADRVGAFLHAHLHALAKQVHLRHRAAAVRRVDERLVLGRGLEKVLICLLLIFEAAHEPAARAGNFRGVEAQILRLGHLDGDRLEIVQKFLAAERPSAHAEAAHHLRLVSDADLPQLDARAEGRRKVFDELPEVDAAFGRKEEEDLAAVERNLGGDELHVQLVVRDFLLADLESTLFLLLIVAVDALILRGGKAQYLAKRRHDLRRFHLVPHPGADAKFIAARRLNDHMRAQARPKLTRVKEIRLRVVAEAHVHHRHTLGLLGQFLLHACRLIGHGLQFRLRLRKLCLHRRTGCFLRRCVFRLCLLLCRACLRFGFFLLRALFGFCCLLRRHFGFRLFDLYGLFVYFIRLQGLCRLRLRLRRHFLLLFVHSVSHLSEVSQYFISAARKARR